MKNRYILMHRINLDIIEKEKCASVLFYNEDCNGWIAVQKYATVYTNKRKAQDKLKYASKYASGCEYDGKFEVFQLANLQIYETGVSK